MTISTTASRISYNGNGATVAFSFPYRFLENRDIVVVLRSSTGSESILLLGTHYTLSGAGDDAGGTVTMAVAPAVGERLVIYRSVAITQETDYISGDPFPAETHERALDRAAMIDQQQQDSIDRTLRFPVSDTVSPELPTQAVRANKLLAFDASGNPTTAVPATDSATDVRVDMASASGSDLVGFVQSGTGAVERTVQDELRETVKATQFVSLDAAAVGCQTAETDGTGRTVAKTLHLPAGRYTISGLLQLAPANGLTGFTVKGAGAASTFIDFSGSSASIACQSSRAITFEDIAFVGSAVDDNQSTFTVAAGGNPLRSWRFNRCDFYAFYKCFTVTGATLCSEFFFEQCNFSNCYHLIDNSNEQAVNWNFQDCNWENESLVTTKDKNLAAVFKLQKGTFAQWLGGSLIFHGMLVYFNLTTSNAFSRTSHKLHFGGVRIELEDLSGSHAKLIDRVSSGYVNGGNAPTVSLSDFTMLNRGTLPATLDLFSVWGNCSLSMVNGECEGGYVVGILDGVTAASNASVFIQDVRGILYREDTTSRVNSHDQHNVTLIPDVSSAGIAPVAETRLCSLTVPASVMPKTIYVRGPTGSLPQSATSVNLPALIDHTMLLKLFVYRFTVAGQSLTADLRDQADTTSYGSVTLAAGVTNGEVFLGKEMGQQITSGTPLMLKFTGSAPEVVKGVVGVEYL